MAAPGTGDGRTVVTDPLRDRLLMWIGLPILGALAVWVLKLIAGWVAGLSWAPFQGAFRLAADVPEPVATLAAFALGAAGGLVLAYLGHVESLVLTLEGDAVEAAKDGRRRTIGRHEIDRVCLSGKELVLLSPDGAEPLRARTETKADVLADAFRAHGYTWVDADPYAARFARWVDGAEGLPPGANAILKARQKARDKDDKDDSAELRDELAKLGVVVRDEKKRQYWRPAKEG
ncbi:YqeB family protein [Phytomonospora endophytica]|uniref:DUF308 domain-containing protein n=1 Tax=Phytomonospora endophytica TaxID=714109 RepID=A0A841FDG1_9ACTN|nr:hypothetical protein [Phytomonospora endophytica]MBB6033485.1 hypothetical protein [Phytomonospora endophytica]GIG64997.1 hypothetical protein Pen01_12920 [Phytomonospora endophytica]